MKRCVLVLGIAATLATGSVAAQQEDSLEAILGAAEAAQEAGGAAQDAPVEGKDSVLTADAPVEAPAVGNPSVPTVAAATAPVSTPPVLPDVPTSSPAQAPQIAVAPLPTGPNGGVPAAGITQVAKEPLLSPEERTFASEEERLLREIRVAQLQKALMEERAGIAEAQREMLGEREESSTPASLDLAARTNPNIVDLPPPEPFHLVSIWGEPGSLAADLFVNGLRVTTRQGDEVAQGWRIAKIEPTRITAIRGKEKKVMQLGTLRK